MITLSLMILYRGKLCREDFVLRNFRTKVLKWELTCCEGVLYWNKEVDSRLSFAIISSHHLMQLWINFLTSTIKGRGMSRVYLILSSSVYLLTLRMKFVSSCIYFLILLGTGNLKSLELLITIVYFLSLLWFNIF